MPAKELLNRLPTFWRILRVFTLRPRQFPKTVLDKNSISVKESLAWTIGFSLLLVNLYGVAFGSLIKNMFTWAGVPTQAQEEHGNKSSHPTIHGIYYRLSCGINFNAQNWANSDEPQRIMFQFGGGIVVLDDVKLSDLAESTILPLLLLLYAFSLMVCIHFPALILKGRASFITAIRLSELYFGYLWLIASLLMVSTVLLLGNIFHLRRLPFVLLYTLFAAIPVSIISIRSFFAVFSQAYEISKWRVTLACFMGWLLSFAIFPSLFVPVLYVVVRFTPLWKSIL